MLIELCCVHWWNRSSSNCTAKEKEEEVNTEVTLVEDLSKHRGMLNLSQNTVTTLFSSCKY